MIDEKKLIECIESMPDNWGAFVWRSVNKIKRELVAVIRNQPKIGGWIPCSERMPEEHDSMFARLKGTDKWNDAMFKKTSNEANATIEFEGGKRKVITSHTCDGKWMTDICLVKFKVIAWQPLPEPYRPQPQRS